jgi:anti-sigma factor RsiW
MSDRDNRNTRDIQDTERDSALGELVRSGATYHAASPALRQQITGALRAQSAQPAPAWMTWRTWLNIGVGFACGAIATWLAFMLPVNADPAERIENEVIAAHSRSLMATHATDVASSDQHTVKPWLSARLDFSPPVPDLSADGFPLTGGRLDYVAERPVAALVYQRHQHVINVFVWPATDTGSAISRNASRKGFNTVAWNQGGMQYWVVTDLGNGELNSFTQLLRQRNLESR